MDEKRTEKLKKIRDEIWNLKSSPFYQYRTDNNYYPVIGEGSHSAPIVFIGEAPGENEAKTGRPFCGAAGRILDQLLESIDMPRQDVYITNVVKDRPPANRDPNAEEITLYSPFLVRQLNIIKPEMVVTLGRFSMDFIMRLLGLEDKLDSISRIHGKVFDAQSDWGKIKVITFFHPAVAIYNAHMLNTLKKDFQILKDVKKEHRASSMPN